MTAPLTQGSLEGGVTRTAGLYTREPLKKGGRKMANCNECKHEGTEYCDAHNDSMHSCFQHKDLVLVVRCKDCVSRVPIDEEQYSFKGKAAMFCIRKNALCNENGYCDEGIRREK